MIKLRILALMSIMTLGLTGCEHFRGTLTVYDNFTMKNHHIANRSAKYVPGTYLTKITLHTVQDLLEIDAEGHSIIKFKVPHDFKNHNGAFELKGLELNEQWNAQGIFASEIYDTPQRPGTTSCILYYRNVIVGWNNNIPIYSSEPVYGLQNVIKHDRVTNRKLELHFVSLDGKTKLADLTGDDPSTVTLIDQVTSACY